jgi:uncharacterized OB-fold protein
VSRAWRGNLPFESLYTAGLAGQKFLAALKEKAQILGTRCNRCDMTYVPARHYCERCMAELPEYLPMGDRGTVVSTTVVHRDVDGNPLDPPQGVAAVRLEGASTVLVHRLLGKAKIGAKVKVVFETRRKGSILDIRGFEPVS